MDSKAKETINGIKGLLMAEFKYLEALEINDADVSDGTLDILLKQVSQSFDQLQNNAIIDISSSFDKSLNEDKDNSTCKFVSLF